MSAGSAGRVDMKNDWRKLTAMLLTASMVLCSADACAFAQNPEFSGYESDYDEFEGVLSEDREDENIFEEADTISLTDQTDQLLSDQSVSQDLSLPDQAAAEDASPDPGDLDPMIFDDGEMEGFTETDLLFEDLIYEDAEFLDPAAAEEQSAQEPSSDEGTDPEEETEPDTQSPLEEEPAYQILEAQVLSEDMVIDADAVFREDGILDLNGHTLTINGDLLNTNGAIFIHAGTLNVAGDFTIRIDHSQSDATNGALVMLYKEDHVTVGGDFRAGGKNEVTLNGTRISEILTAGTLEVKGDFLQIPPGSFRPSNRHKVILNGTGIQFVLFMDKWNAFQTLEITQDKQNYRFNSFPCWTNLIKDGQEETKEGFYDLLMSFDGYEAESERSITINGYVGTATHIEVPEMVRDYPVTKIGSEAFAGLGEVETIELPDSIQYMGSYAFADCASLQEFDVPLGLTELIATDFVGCNSLKKVIIRNPYLHLQGNFASVGDITFYVIKDTAVEYDIRSRGWPCEYIANENFSFHAEVADEENRLISSGYTVSWMEKDSGLQLGTGDTLARPAPDKTYVCRILLDEELSYLYAEPEEVEFIPDGQDQTKRITLQKIDSFTINGTVKNKEGEGIPYADIAFSQVYNGQYEKTVSVRADESGVFSAVVDRVPTSVLFSANGYYNSMDTLDETAPDGTLLEAVLTKTPLDRIRLTLKKLDAAEPGKMQTSSRIDSFSGISLSAFNETKEAPLTDLQVQYPYLYPSASSCDAGDVIRISLRDDRQEMVCEDVRVTLDEQKCAQASCVFLENGKVRVSGLQGKQGFTVMLFDAQGKLADSDSVASAYLSCPLPSGDYTCIMMNRTSLFRKAERLETLREYGLTEGTDYAAYAIQVKEGIVSTVSGITVPDLDESKLYYTVKDNTYYLPIGSEVVAGQYAGLLARYELQEEVLSSEETVLLELPEEVTFIPGSVTVNGEAALYMQEDRMIKVPVNAGKGAIRFKVAPTSVGEKTFYASLSFRYDQTSVLQPIGSCTLEVYNATINVPEKTRERKVTASGKAIPGCSITVYDNDVEAGTAVSRKNGSWDCSFNLNDTDTHPHSVHKIYASITSPDDQIHIVTETSEILYSAIATEVMSVYMINTGHDEVSRTPREFVTYLDFHSPVARVPYYRYWPAYPTFTFAVYIRCEEPELLYNVFVVTEDSGGSKSYVRCRYDETSNVWIGKYPYSSFSDVPCKVSVTYSEQDNVYEQSYGDNLLSEQVIEAEELKNILVADIASGISDEDVSIEDNTVTIAVNLGGKQAAIYKAESLDIAEFHLEEWEAVNCQTIEFEDGVIAYQSSELTEDSYIRYYACPEEELLIRETVTLIGTADTGAGTGSGGGTGSGDGTGNGAVTRTALNKALLPPSLFDKLDNYLPFFYFTGEVLEDIKDLRKPFDHYQDLQANIHILNDGYNRVRKKVYCCSCVEDSQYETRLDYLAEQIDKYETRCLQAIIAATTIDAALYCSRMKIMKRFKPLIKDKHYEAFKNFYRRFAEKKKGRLKKWVKFLLDHGAEIGIKLEEKLFDEILDVSGLLDLLDFSGNMIKNGYNDLMEDIFDFIDDLERDACPCYEEYGMCPCEKGDPATKRRVKPIEDPSGYVYEAVPSNRVSGVKAELYGYDYAVDENGQQAADKSEILWDAENYDQINPQYTDVDGYFGWDVPEGLWAIKFSKEGYEDTDSYQDPAANSEGYIPVPPIQTEINTAVVSKSAPEVALVSAYTGQIRIEFSQYMQIDTINTDNIQIIAGNGDGNENTDGNGNGTANGIISGTLRPLNAEMNYEQTQTYASVFAFESTEPMSGSVTVSIRNVRNYVGTLLASEYRQTHTVMVMPEDLVTSGGDAVLLHGDTQMSIRILPGQAGSGRKISVVSYSPSIVTVDSSEVIADEAGGAVVVLHGELPGEGILGISIEGTDLYLEKKVLVGDAAQNVTFLEENTYPVTLSPSSFIYNGQEQKPQVSIAGLTEGRDFEVSYTDNINAGTGTVTVTGIGNCFGILKKSFVISQAGNTITASDLKVQASEKSQMVSINASASSGKITYKSDDPTIQVDSGGVVTLPGQFVGKVVITITAGDANYKTVTRDISITAALRKNVITAADRQIICPARNQTISLNVVQSGAGKLIYSSNQKDIKVNSSGVVTIPKKYIGKAEITITAAAAGIYAEGKKTVVITVNPATPKWKSVKKAKGGKAVAKWKKDAACSGYELQYSMNKKFASGVKTVKIKKNKTVSKTITKLQKGKTYYVRLRAYKKFGSTVLYSAWSAVKKVKG